MESKSILSNEEIEALPSDVSLDLKLIENIQLSQIKSYLKITHEHIIQTMLNNHKLMHHLKGIKLQVEKPYSNLYSLSNIVNLVKEPLFRDCSLSFKSTMIVCVSILNL